MKWDGRANHKGPFHGPEICHDVRKRVVGHGILIVLLHFPSVFFFFFF